MNELDYGWRDTAGGVITSIFGILFSYLLYFIGVPVPISPILGFMFALIPTVLIAGYIEKKIDEYESSKT